MHDIADPQQPAADPALTASLAMAVVGMENKFNLDLLITYQRVKQIPVVAVAVVLEMVKMAVAA